MHQAQLIFVVHLAVAYNTYVCITNHYLFLLFILFCKNSEKFHHPWLILSLRHKSYRYPPVEDIVQISLIKITSLGQNFQLNSFPWLFPPLSLPLWKEFGSVWNWRLYSGWYFNGSSVHAALNSNRRSILQRETPLHNFHNPQLLHTQGWYITALFIFSTCVFERLTQGVTAFAGLIMLPDV